MQHIQNGVENISCMSRFDRYLTKSQRASLMNTKAHLMACLLASLQCCDFLPGAPLFIMAPPLEVYSTIQPSQTLNSHPIISAAYPSPSTPPPLLICLPPLRHPPHEQTTHRTQRRINRAPRQKTPEIQLQPAMQIEQQCPRRRHNLRQWPRPALVEEPRRQRDGVEGGGDV
jgi:hypothetical protein